MNYQARRHEIEFTFTPYYDSAPLDYTTAAKTLQLTYLKTTLLYDRLHNTTTGLDPTAVRPTSNVPKDPQVPIVSTDDPRLSLDIEGSVEDKDGSYVFLFLFVMSLRDLTFTFFQKGFGSAMNTVLTSITIQKMGNLSQLSNPLMRYSPVTAMETSISLALKAKQLEGLQTRVRTFRRHCPRLLYSYIHFCRL